MTAPSGRQDRTVAQSIETNDGAGDHDRAFRRVWRWPTVIGIASLVGLVSALLGDGIWDALSWVTLVIPVVIAGAVWRRAHLPSS